MAPLVAILWAWSNFICPYFLKSLEINLLTRCLREPISEIFEAAERLSNAVSAHLAGDHRRAESLIRAADSPSIRHWTESLWGAGGPWTRPLKVQNPLPFLGKKERSTVRMPSNKEKSAILLRDGYHCRFCGIPVARAEIRHFLHRFYPDALPWGARNIEQHAGFQAVWLQYDHILPHARGGGNELDNILITCAPCNNGRSNLTLDEAGLSDPFAVPPLRTEWDGLERLLAN